MEIDFVSLADFLEELAEGRGEKLQGAATFLAGRLRASPSHEWLINNPSAPYIKPASPEERQRLTRLLRYVADHGTFEHPDTRPPVRTGATIFDHMYRAASPAEISQNPDRLYSIGGFHREEVEQIVGNNSARAPEKERVNDGDDGLDRVTERREFFRSIWEKLGKPADNKKIWDELKKLDTKNEPLDGQIGPTIRNVKDHSTYVFVYSDGTSKEFAKKDVVNRMSEVR